MKVRHLQQFRFLPGLLRTLQSPARVVVGFHGGERAAGEYLIRAGDAHAWVEAEIDGYVLRLDATPPHFCHISAPLVTLFISGDAAGKVERLQPVQAIAYVKDILAPVEEMQGFEAYVVGEPIITRWVGNPYTQGAYSACLPGGKRSWPVAQGNIMLCGDMFDPNYFSSLAGAYRSGLAAARLFDESERLLK